MPLWNVVSGYCDEWVCLSKLFMPTSLGLEYVYHGDNGVIFVEESLNLRLIIFHFRWQSQYQLKPVKNPEHFGNL